MPNKPFSISLTIFETIKQMRGIPLALLLYRYISDLVPFKPIHGHMIFFGAGLLLYKGE